MAEETSDSRSAGARGPRRPWFLGVAVLAAGVAALAVGLWTRGNGGAVTVPSAHVPVVRLVEGAPGHAYPYQPRTLRIPAGRLVSVGVTDHIGGCLLATVFVGLGPHGGDVVVSVPVGDTRYVLIRASHGGSYSFHCGGEMYSGRIVAG